MQPGRRFRRPESLVVFGTVVRNRALVRVESAFVLFNLAEIATWIAILVYAYNRGGAAEAGLIAFVQLVPAIPFALVGSALGDRIPRERALLISYLAAASTTGLTAAALLLDWAPVVVYATAVIAALAITLTRPAQGALLPGLSRTPNELTAANVASGTIESIGLFAGSLGAGLVLELAGPGAVFAACTVCLFTGALAVAGVRPLPGAAMPGAGAEAGSASAPELREAESGPPEPPALDPGPPGGSIRATVVELGAGVLSVHRDRQLRTVVLVIGVGTALVGALDVLAVVLAIDVLMAGEAGVGLINAAAAVGAFVGATAAISLVGRRRLGRPLLVGSLVFGLGIAAAGVFPVMLVALGAIAIATIGRAIVEVAGRTLIQRLAPDEVLTRVFGVLESLNMAALAAGAIVAPLLVLALGPMGAFAVAGLAVPVVTLLARSSLAEADRRAVIHERELALLQAIPMFAPLAPPVLERLASGLRPLQVPLGTVIIREGEAGDRYYVLAAGEVEITIQGRVVRRQVPVDGFGEIALLRDIPRTATVTALTDLELFTLDREPFLEAITGRPSSHAVASAIVEERLAAR
jgi:MFS family permease